MVNEKYLPMTRKDMEKRGWDQCDFILVTGDAYVDHPSFGAAIISRLLEKYGYKVGIIAQPDWKDLDSFKVLGEPLYAFLVTAGNIDSMVNHYTAAKKRRSTDAYSPGGKIDLRPDRATIVYSNRLREAAPGTPIIIGGIEASLRRFAHYDYWSNKVRHSILTDSQADMLIFGMAEKTILEVSRLLREGYTVNEIVGIRGTMIPWKTDIPQGAIELPSYDEVIENKQKHAKAFWEQHNQQDPYRGKTMFQNQGRTSVIQYPPAFPLTSKEMDDIYDLPFAGSYHPNYESLGGVPAIKEVEFSLVSSRGCYGSCSFCALTFHQGRIVQGRSHESIIKEAKRLTKSINFKGFIHDVGGPTANFRKPACTNQLRRGACSHKQCLFPEPCSQLELDHDDYLDLLKKLRSLPEVKKIFVRSGIRYDAVVADKDTSFLEELCKHHISGQLKVAPEHVSENVLKRMGKPGVEVYRKFTNRFQKVNQKLGKKQFIIPYLMSSHPGSTLRDAIILAEYVRDMGVNPEQVQDFIPTPGTLSTCMYYTGFDPRTMEKVYIPRSMHEKAMQRALIQYRDPKNYDLVKEALLKAGREDLIGYGPKCLIKPNSSPQKARNYSQTKNNKEQGKEKLTAHLGKEKRKRKEKEDIKAIKNKSKSKVSKENKASKVKEKNK